MNLHVVRLFCLSFVIVFPLVTVIHLDNNIKAILALNFLFMFTSQNEGIEEVVTIQVCLDPNKQMEDCANTPKRVEPGKR